MSESSFNNADQRNAPQSKILQEEKQDAYKAGQPNSHENLDSKDERSIKNRLAAEEKRKEPRDDPETEQLKIDPRRPAEMHGNEPSKGAKIDAELEAEDEERLREKGIKK